MRDAFADEFPLLVGGLPVVFQLDPTGAPILPEGWAAPYRGTTPALDAANDPESDL